MLKPYSDKNFFLYVPVFLFSLSSLSFLLLSSYQVSADDVYIDDVSLAVPISCSMSGTGMNTHNATITNGTYQDDIGTTTLKVFCNDTSGFAIYAAGYTNNTIGETDSNKLVGSISGSGEIITGLATTTGNPDVSNWAMKLTATGDSGDTSGTNALTIDSAPNTSGGSAASFASYHVVPNEYTKVAHKNSATSLDETTGGATLTTTYAAYISKTQAAGSYQGQVIYTLVHPATNIPNQERTCPANKVCYWPNAGDMTVGGVGVVDTMGDQTPTSSETSNGEVTLWASNFKRSGYGFVGWSDAYDYVANVGSNSNPNAHIYGPNETITIPSDLNENGLSLYAVWVPSAGSLQGWNGCSSLGSGKVTALTDTRDQDTYAVAKLADGNCWMIENLRLDYDANITTANTQSNNGAFGGVFSGLAEPETANFSNSTTANSLYKSDGSGDIKGVNGATLTDIGTAYVPAYRFPRYRNDNTNTNSTINPNTTVSNMTGTDQNVYSYGNYYTWAAALANTNFYSGQVMFDENYDSENANTSLCPTGWKLPRGGGKVRVEGGTNDFYTLSSATIDIAPTACLNDDPCWTDDNNTDGTNASKAMRAYPNNFVYAGIVETNLIYHHGSKGFYWSSSAATGFTISYSASILSTSVDPAGSGTFKYDGISIRCLVGS